MALKLNTSTSIVDFLKSQKKESSFSARRKLFEEGGFEKRLGSFKGSSSQNLALLKSLQQSDNSASGAVEKAKEFTTPSGATGTVEQLGALGGQTPQIPGQIPQTTTLPEIPQIAPPSAQDVLAKARGETSVQIAEQEAQIDKERIAGELPGKLTAVKNEFASRGLVFSGARTLQEQEVRDQALSQKLDVDIRFAKILGSAIDRAANDLGKEIEDVIKEAKEGRAEQIKFLRDMGLAVNPQTGELFPTLSAQKEGRILQQQEIANELAAARFAHSQAKDAITIEQANQRIAIAERNLALAGIREARLQEGDKGGELSSKASKIIEDAANGIGDLQSIPPTLESAASELVAQGLTPTDFLDELGETFGETQARGFLFSEVSGDIQDGRSRDFNPNTIVRTLEQDYGDLLTSGEGDSLLNEAGYYKQGGQWWSQL